MAAKKRDVNKPNEEKLDLAKRIAGQSQKVARTYANIENAVMRTIRWFSAWFDKVLFNARFGKIVSLFLAILLYITVNYGSGQAIFKTATSSGDVIKNIPVNVVANDEVYEISGIPETVNAYIVGELSDITLIQTQKAYSVVADLTGLLEGTHEVTLTATNFSSRVDVALTPSTAVVTIKKKISQRFSLGYEFVNTDKMNQTFILNEPVMDASEVIIRASQSTLESIGYVKALIDVTNVDKNFTQESTIVAYDQKGNRLAVDIIPATVKVTVNVSSPNKSVPVVVVPTGEIPGGLAIDSIALDHTSVTLYGSETILNALNEIQVPINATTLTGNKSLVAEITLPSGVKKSSVTRVNMQITVAAGVTKTLENITIDYHNNDKGYRFTLTDNSTAYAKVTLFGTQKNVDSITAENISIYIDMANVTLGVQTVPLYVSGSNNLVSYTLERQTISINVIK